MYSCRIKTVISTFGIVGSFGLSFCAFGIDVTEEISAVFQKRVNLGESDSYLESLYKPSYSKDPFNDALENIESMSIQKKMVGIDYIEKALAGKNCSLSKKKIQSILYYFVPEFKAELARQLKLESGEFDDSKLVFDEDKIELYCAEYYYCDKYALNVGDFGKYVGKLFGLYKGDTVGSTITASTPANLMSNCEEFFKNNYEKGKSSKQNIQDVEVAQVGADKYWNSTTDDSPYDIMMDFGGIGKLLYTDVEQPLTPILYKLPMFSNSVKSLQNHKENGSSYNNGGNAGGGAGIGNNDGKNIVGENGESPESFSKSSDDYEGSESKGEKDKDSSDPQPLPLSSDVDWLYMDEEYDNLVEGLGSLKVTQEDGLYYGSLCEDGEQTLQNGVLAPNESDEELSVASEYDLTSLSDKELEDVLDYVKSAVNKYAELSDEQKKEIKNIAGDTGGFVNDVTPDDLERTAKKIKNCWQSCNGLRYDQKASCMLMCACGEIESPIFDPDKNPGLGPILIVRFCAVPATNTKFSIGGRKMISIQEGMNEIFGVTDKLSREGRLGIWTQQYNFLDSTTKKTNVSKTVAFTISVETLDTSEKTPQRSDQYEKKEASLRNKEWQTEYYISNGLDNPVLKNRYRLVAEEGETLDDFSASVNSDWTRQNQSSMNVVPSHDVNLVKNARYNRYINITETLGKFLDQQGSLRTETNRYINQLDEYAKALYAKRG